MDSLAEIRTCMRSKRAHKLALKTAERKLMEALVEDRTMTLAHYNLGVVYTRLAERAETSMERERHRRAAERAFHHQTELEPERWEAYFALARTYFNEIRDVREPNDPGNLDTILPLCSRVIDLRPGWRDIARVYQLRSETECLLSGGL